MKAISWDDLDDAEKNLIKKSQEAMSRAYSKYSNFAVGAALLSSDGQIILGVNVENASYGLTLCAERCAVVKAVSEGIHKFESIAVSAVTTGSIVTPCGACRQFMAEFNPNLKIYLYNPTTKEVAISNMNILLPASYCFDFGDQAK